MVIGVACFRTVANPLLAKLFIRQEAPVGNERGTTQRATDADTCRQKHMWLQTNTLKPAHETVHATYK